MILEITSQTKNLSGRVRLGGSKSISNRALILGALSNGQVRVEGLSVSDDTRLLQAALGHPGPVFDAGDAGTAFRFLTALFSFRDGVQTLTGSDRMKERPIGPLVDALRSLGANINYLEREGFPPLRIDEAHLAGAAGTIRIPANMSSQFVSAILMVAPTLPGGVRLELSGKVVSRPYLRLTLELLRFSGIDCEWNEDHIRVEPGSFRPVVIRVEPDWSAASYYYGLLACSTGGQLQLDGLQKDSWQGDSRIAELMLPLGVGTRKVAGGLMIEKQTRPLPAEMKINFLDCPDLVQTMAFTLGALGIRGEFTGLDTLRIKETDRVSAIGNELRQMGLKTRVTQISGQEVFQFEGKPDWDLARKRVFETYGDHRMALSLSILSRYIPLQLRDPGVVSKSYPGFWDDLGRLGLHSRMLG